MYVELRYYHNWRGTELLWSTSIRSHPLHSYENANKISRQYKKDMMLFLIYWHPFEESRFLVDLDLWIKKFWCNKNTYCFSWCLSYLRCILLQKSYCTVQSTRNPKEMTPPINLYPIYIQSAEVSFYPYFPTYTKISYLRSTTSRRSSEISNIKLDF